MVARSSSTLLSLKEEGNRTRGNGEFRASGRPNVGYGNDGHVAAAAATDLKSHTKKAPQMALFFGLDNGELP